MVADAPDAGMKVLPVAVRESVAAVSVPMKVARPTLTLEIELGSGVVRFYGPPDPELLQPFVSSLSGR